MVADDDEVELGNVTSVDEVVVQAALAIGMTGVAVHVTPVHMVLGLCRGSGGQQQQAQESKPPVVAGPLHFILMAQMSGCIRCVLGSFADLALGHVAGH